MEDDGDVAGLATHKQWNLRRQRGIQALLQFRQLFRDQLLLQVPAADGLRIGCPNQVGADRLDAVTIDANAQPHVQQVHCGTFLALCLHRQMLLKTYANTPTLADQSTSEYHLSWACPAWIVDMVLTILQGFRKPAHFSSSFEQSVAIWRDTLTVVAAVTGYFATRRVSCVGGITAR